MPLAPVTSLDDVVNGIDEISALPDVALRVLEVTRDPDAGAQQLKAALEDDVALCARVLRVVNSSAYSLREPVSNLQLAIAYMGFRQIRNLALTASVSDVFQQGDAIGRYSRSGLWRHSVAVGVTARMIAMRRGMDNFEDVFLAGLLHDIGIILEDQFAHAAFCAMLESLDAAKSLEDSERQTLGFTHTQLGAEVATRWGFPELVIQAIRDHHVALVEGGGFAQETRCVQVANILCSFKGITSIGVNLLRPSATAANKLGLSKAALEALLTEMDAELAQHADWFEL